MSDWLPMFLVFPSKKLQGFYKSKSENKIVENCLKHFADSPKPELCLSQFSSSTEEKKGRDKGHEYELVAG